jgi:Domain of unknown function (DUF4826)
MDSDETSTIEDHEEAKWVAAQRQIVVDYLVNQRLQHGGVSLEPPWFLSPYLAVWAIRSSANSDLVGWWAVSGDVPTDYITCRDEQDPGDVLTEFSKVWKAAAKKMAVGKQLDNSVIGGGDPARAKELAPLLLRRAEMLEELAAGIKSGKFPWES